jgi:prepilin signal peptidase PulO-like enzyme (type II secretory pathway)
MEDHHSADSYGQGDVSGFPQAPQRMPRRPRNKRWNFWRNSLLWLVLAIFLFMGVLPTIESLLPYNAELSLRLEWFRSRIMESLIAIWFLVFGSMVGSFMNVVVWRMPRGVSVVSKGSACPYCRAPIRLRDNIPVLGWLKLGGRCRVCHLPISPRYPIVEAIFGVVFLAVFLATVPTAAGNLPGGPRYELTGVLQTVITPKWDVIALYAFHVTLLSLLLAWSLMQLDHSRLPGRTIVFALLTGFVAPAFLVYLHPVPWLVDYDRWLVELPVIKRFDTGFAGLAAGFLVGEFLDQMAARRSGRPAEGYNTACLMTTGLFLGWQALATTIVLFGGLRILAIRLLPQRPGVTRLPATGWLVLATLIQICFWRWIQATVSATFLGDGAFAILLLSGALLLAGPSGFPGTFSADDPPQSG